MARPMPNSALITEDRAGGFAVTPAPPQPAFPRYSGYFAEHRAAMRFADALKIVTGLKVIDRTNPAEMGA